MKPFDGQTMPIRDNAERKQYMRNYYKRHRKALLRKRKKRRDEDRKLRRVMTDPHVTIGYDAGSVHRELHLLPEPGGQTVRPKSKRKRARRNPERTVDGHCPECGEKAPSQKEHCESLIAAGQTVKPKRKPVKPKRKRATRKPSKGGKIDQRSRQERRRETGEDFTPIPLVNRVLDCFEADVWDNPDKVFLDPSCGNGNFLVEVKKRLLAAGHSEENALSRILGIDIMHDNVVEACERLGVDHHPEASCAVSATIICANTLEHELQELFDMAEKEFKKAKEMAS